MPTVGAADHAELIRVEKRGGLPALAGAPGEVVDAIRFRVSSESEDAFGDVVVQAGLEFPSSLPAVADHSHRLDSTLGDWQHIERAGPQTFATLRLLPPGASRMADLVRAMHAGGFPLASSVYFDIARSNIEPIMKAGAGGRLVQTGMRYLRGKVREITLTQFPANAEAVAVARSLGFNDTELAALSRPLPAGSTSVARTTVAVAGAPTLKATAMTLAEMIAAAQAQLDTAQGSLGTATAALETDSSEANLQSVARATTEVDALFARLNVLRGAESAAARRAGAAPAAAPAAPTAVARAVATVAAPAVISRQTNTTDKPAGYRLAQITLACHVARARGCGVDQVVQELFANEPETIAIARSLVGSADTTTVGWAAELVRAEARAMLDAAAGPTSIWPTLAALGQSLNFGGSQSILVPQSDIGVSTGSTAWVGEAGAIPVVKGSITGKRLWRYKLAGIIPITKELERASDPAAVEVMRGMLRQFLSNLLDTSMLDASAEVVGVRPAGLLNGVVPIAGALGGGYAAFQADLSAVNAAFSAANVGTKPVILVPQSKLFTLRTMTNALGQFVFADGATSALGYAVVGSRFIAANTMVAVAAENFASAIDGFDYSTSDQATLQMANADAVAPTQSGASQLGGALGVAGQVIPDGGIPISGGNGASIAGSVAISLWQTWQTGIRLVVPAGFGLTRAGSVQQVTATTW
jgi:HK97 family phage major capsid protein